MTFQLTIDPPLYLIGKMYSCRRCTARMPVVTLLAPNIEAASLYMTEVPVPGRIQVRASPAMGCGDLIINNARRIA